MEMITCEQFRPSEGTGNMCLVLEVEISGVKFAGKL
jgi:hypothetical protein